MARDISELVSKLTLEEKASLCSGLDFWHTKAVDRQGIPSVMVSDGPHGLRKQDMKADHLGFNESIKAVCFPAGCALACSFDRDLARELGETLGDECQAQDVAVLLGPAVNIKRSPLCGRNFEYLSEDPFLASRIAASHIAGVQSKNVGTSIKHFAANNQEYRRMTSSSELDERTLREIYLAAFEEAIKEGRPDTVMCSYNRINGVFAAENERLLTKILRDEWGFSGYVMSDWGAVNNRVEGLKAGLDLEMPSSNGVTDREIVEAVRSGKLAERVLDASVARILEKVFKFADNRKEGNFDLEKHDALAGRIAEESAVLLKNNGLLPLDPAKAGEVLYVGQFAKKPRYQGGGSSHINSFRVTGALEASAEIAPGVRWVEGFKTDSDAEDPALAAEALAAAKQAKAVVIFAGLPDSYESEGYDRAHMRLPENQNKLIAEILKVRPETAVVLHNGSPVEMPWASGAAAILEAYLGGQAVGRATSRILFGLANPSGKLAESFPLKLEDTPCFIDFPGDGKTAQYKEGVFVGYRWYDKRKMDVLFPFGHGLSYTSFAYSGLKTDKTSITEGETLSVSVDVENTGKREGKETVQLYVRDTTGSAVRPVRELKGFAKVHLKPGEKKTVSFALDKRAFAWYSQELGDWYAAPGEYAVEIGRSSRDIEASVSVMRNTSQRLPFHVDLNTTIEEILADERTAAVLKPMLDKMEEMFKGGGGEAANEAITPAMISAMIANFPLRALRSFSGAGNEEIEGLLKALNQAASGR